MWGDLLIRARGNGSGFSFVMTNFGGGAADKDRRASPGSPVLVPFRLRRHPPSLDESYKSLSPTVSLCLTISSSDRLLLIITTSY